MKGSRVIKERSQVKSFSSNYHNPLQSNYHNPMQVISSLVLLLEIITDLILQL